MLRVFNIRRSGYFKQLMMIPERLYEALQGYFLSLNLLEVENELGFDPQTDARIHEQSGDVSFEPRKRLAATVPGLISYLGADRTLFFEIRSSDKHSDRYPSESVHYIRQACLLIEDETIQAAIIGKGNPAFAKFLLSAYNDASEKTVSETVSTHNHLHISLAQPDSIDIGLGEQFRRESKRLEGKTSCLINKRIDLGEIAEDARITSSGPESGDATDAIDVQFEEVPDDLGDDDFI